MALVWSIVSFTFTLFFMPILMFLLGMIFLASINRSLGVRRLYVQLLLKIFEYGKQHIEIAQRDRDRESSREGSGEEDQNKQNEDPSNHVKSFVKNNSVVISREKLILLPDPEMNYTGNNNLTVPESDSKSVDFKSCNNNGNVKRREFELDNIFDYIRTGVEAIIEDQVTSRFKAEELRSWNLLTRTNHNYEFLSWRLTIIWAFGFVFRYVFLLPLRVLICFFGVLSQVVMTAVVGCIPEGRIKRYLASYAMLVPFRILMRSLSVVINIHDKEFRPQKGGICVANHTSPIDIGILATDTVFSLTLWLTLCMAVVGNVPDGPFKRWLHAMVSKLCFEILSSAISLDSKYHNVENRPKCGSICVANHTSPIDVLVLECDNCYSLIGQRHGGFLGILQRAVARASPHIWFERSEVKDRSAVAARLKEHVSDPNNPPILIFPEGTCINNTSVMQFKKGSFEVGSVVYPVAIKYDARFGDAFWNSSKYSMLQYLYCMMTSWAIVCDVWYLPAMYKQPGESSIDFANRVKHVIAERGGLVDLVWDGQLKRMAVKKEWKERQQEEFSKRLKVE